LRRSARPFVVGSGRARVAQFAERADALDASVIMDVLFADALGETARVQTRACDDPDKGKGVFAIAPIAEGEVALRDAPLGFVTSRELSIAASLDPSAYPASPHVVCAECRCDAARRDDRRDRDPAPRRAAR
jgi:hypothetical protein